MKLLRSLMEKTAARASSFKGVSLLCGYYIGWKNNRARILTILEGCSLYNRFQYSTNLQRASERLQEKAIIPSMRRYERDVT